MHEIRKSETDYYKYRVTLLREQVDQLKQSVGYSLPPYIQPIVNDEEVVDILLDIRENINTFLKRFNYPIFSSEDVSKARNK